MQPEKINADLYYCNECKCLSKKVEVVYEKEQEENYAKALKRHSREQKRRLMLENLISKELVGIIQEAIKLKLLEDSVSDIRGFLLLNYPENSEDMWVDNGARGWFSWRIKRRRWIGLDYYVYPNPSPSQRNNYSITCPICLHKQTFWRHSKET